MPQEEASNYPEEGREVKLRCSIRKINKYYIGICLELNLVVKGKTPYDCREKLDQAINDYLYTIIELYKQKENVIIRPVEFYFLKRILFDLSMFCSNLFNKDKPKPQAGFTKKVVVPFGI